MTTRRTRRLAKRLDPRGAPVWMLLLTPAVLFLLLLAVNPEPERRILGSDLPSYREYGARLLGGSTPYLDFAFEYPPLALVPMTLPLLAASSGGIGEQEYIWRFRVVEGAVAALVGWLLFRGTGGSRTVLATWVLLAALAWVSVALRYDLWPVLCVLIAVLAVERRPGVAGMALGLGTMLKLYPLAVLPVLGAYVLVHRDWGSLARLVGGCAVVVAVVLGGTWLLAGPASLDWLRYYGDRGLQIESLGAGLLLGLNRLVGHPVEVVYAFGSIQVQSPGAELVLAISPIVSAALLGVVTGLAALRFRWDETTLGRVPTSSIALASAAAIAVLLVASKVLSVQYVVWLLPFVPLLPVRLRWLAIVITALSTLIFAIDYAALGRLETQIVAALIVRNTLLAGFAAALVALLATRSGRPVPSTFGGRLRDSAGESVTRGGPDAGARAGTSS